MAAFWFLAGALSSLGLLCLLLPWLRRLPRLSSLPSVPWPVSVSAAAWLATAVGLYLWVARPDLTAAPAAVVVAPTPAPANDLADAAAKIGFGAGSMSSAIAGLQARLAKGTGSAEDWELLAKAYEFLGRPQDAALARAHQLPSQPTEASDTAAQASAVTSATPMRGTPDATPSLTPASLQLLNRANAARRQKKFSEAATIYAKLATTHQLNADGWADYADTTASLHGNRLAGDPETYIAHALAMDARHPKALWLQASADEEAGRYLQAIATWRQLEAVLPSDSSDARIVAANLQQDLKLVGSSAGASAEAGAASSAGAVASASGPAVRGQVSLSESLRARVRGGETLFIVAKSVDAPGPPVAVFRSIVGSWPVSFTLDDSLAMLPGRTLSSASRVTVEARISRSGQAMPVSGDLSGVSVAVDPRAGPPLAIVIDHVTP